MSEKSQLHQLLNNSLLYSVSVVLVKAGHLVLLPLLLTKLSLEDFGIIGLCQSIGVFMSPVFELGISYTVQRLYYDWSESDRWKYISGLYLSCIMFGLAVLGLLYIVGESIFPYLIKSISFLPFIFMVLLISFFTALHQLPISIFRITQNIKSYTALSLFQFFLQSILILYFVFIAEEGVLGYYKGILIASFSVMIYSLWFWAKNFDTPRLLKHFIQPLSFGLPMVPSSVLENFSNVVDRLVLERYVSLEQLGIFSLARQLGYLVGLVNTVLKQSFLPQVYKMQKFAKDFPRQLAMLSTSYGTLLSLACIVVCLLVGPALGIIAKPEYIDIPIFVPVVAVAYLIHSLGTAYGRGYDLAKTNRYFIYISSWTLVSNLAISIVLIKSFGLWGAFFSLLFGAIAKNSLHIFLAYKAFPRPTYLKETFTVVIIPTLVCLWSVGIYHYQVAGWILNSISLFIFSGAILVLNRDFLPIHKAYALVKDRIDKKS